MGTNWKKMKQGAVSRSQIYGLLAAVFREEPNAALVDEFRNPDMLRVFADMDVELGEGFYNAPVSMVAEMLAEEFTRLFIGPGSHISAHESIFAEVDGDSGSLWGTTTVAVKKFIETTGLTYREEYTGIPDHVSVEFEFMQQLTAWEADRWQRKDRAGAQYALRVQQLFLDQHLLPWLPQFCDVVIKRAAVPFYRAMAELSKNYMEFEQQYVTTDAAA